MIGVLAFCTSVLRQRPNANSMKDNFDPLEQTLMLGKIKEEKAGYIILVLAPLDRVEINAILH